MNSSPCRNCGAETRCYPCVSCGWTPSPDPSDFTLGRARGWEEAADFVEANTGKRFGAPLARNMRDRAKEIRERRRR